jgi:DNA-binding NarL/FixJ family response regulator
LKSDAECDLIAAVTSAWQHIPFFSTAVAEFVHRALETKPAAQSLTPREEEVLRMLAQGRSIKEVARGLNVSVKTADNHRTNLMRKLDVHSAAELLRYAIRHHIVEP